MKVLRMLLLLCLVSQHAAGVEVHEGVESVLLPCQVLGNVSRSSTAAVWDRDGLRIQTVHLRRLEGDDLLDQNDRYTHRTSMRADALQTGDLSLTLRNPTGSDSGTYTCTTRRTGEDLSQIKVQLKVKEPPLVWPKALLVTGGLLVLLAAAFGLFVYFAYKRKNSSEALQVEVVEVTEWEESVLLPFETTADLPQDVRVEWSLTVPKLIKVCVFQRSQNPAEEQDRVYRGRTDMKEDALRTGDLGLTLKDPHLTDSGAYMCTVYKGGQILRQKAVTLSFKVPKKEMVEVRQRDRSVWFPFQTKPNLPQDVIVEWSRSDSKNVKVHMLHSGKTQPHNQDQDYRGRTKMNEDPLKSGNLSLMLKYPRLTDSGVYTCTVYNKDGHMLLQKSVTLSIRGVQLEMVKVTRGEEKSVLLPFKITDKLPQDVSVQWRLSEPERMKVHVFERGKNQPDQQHQDYRGRTEMDEDPLRTKDLSLRLKDLQLTDSGVYTCIVFDKDGEFLLQKSVTLRVRDPEVEMVEVTEWEKFVLLPFKATADLPRDVSVEWRLTEPKHTKVHVYERGKKELDMQNCVYRGRTEMDEEPLKTGDFSLTLKDPHFSDSGVYLCTVCNKDGKIQLQKSVSLSIRALEVEFVEVTQGQESAQLPFHTADLPQDVSVEWRLKDMKVHVYKVGENQPDQQEEDYRGRTEMNEKPLRTGDLSLRLKHLQLTDSGVYTCTVYNNDEYILLQKIVTLRVKASLLGTMAKMLTGLKGLRLRRALRTPTKEEVRNHEDVPLSDQSV